MIDSKELRELSERLVAEPCDYMHSFRRNVSMYIDHKGITLSEVAEAADISVSTLKSFLYGDSKDCTLSTAIKLARVFGVSVDELVGSGTLSTNICRSLQTIRQMPESFTHFVVWCIKYHYQKIKSKEVSIRAIEVMTPYIGPEGNLKMTNQMEVYDISDINEDYRPKIFLGIKIPSDIYEPHYFQSDVILIANDRKPINNERIVFSTGDNLWILERKVIDNQVKYVSIRDGKPRASESDIQNILGYIVKVSRK